MRRAKVYPAALVAVGLAACLGVGLRPAAATQPRADAGAPVVTLVTGDQVVGSGSAAGVHVRPGPGRAGMSFAVSTDQGHLYVVPADALALVGSDQVDKALFDVTALREAGYDDAHRADVPILVRYDPAGSVPAPAGARDVRPMRDLHQASMNAPKATAGAVWTHLVRHDGAATRLSPGIGHVWLDRIRHVTLDVSVPQIGAPAVWRAGYTGQGVTVAVLDTGIDATHPDLAGRIAGRQDFTGTSTPGDPVGHGTHVASTVAGSGAASGGRYRGVAPDARLLDARVCTPAEEGATCADSAVLAGMQWAAAQGAQIVNMSFGGPDAPGVDPLEDAVNQLSAQRGMLFVASAGNDHAVSSPGTADAAISVGAVDKSDKLAAFSARGPRVDGGLVKPDLTAPGVDIVAAASSTGTIGTPAGPGYVQLSGTSMAAPHVAGAAALLASAHRDWSAAQVKAALIGSAVPDPTDTVLAQGAGRVDVSRALTQTLTSDPVSLDLGSQAWSRTGHPPVTRQVTYRNTGAQPVTATITVAASGPDGHAAPAGTFTVTPGRVTVPAGGSATVTVTANASRPDAAAGWYPGRITARAPTGTVTTPVVMRLEPETHTLTLRVTDRHGAATPNYRTAVTGYDGTVDAEPYDAGGTVAVRLPAGRYLVSTWVAEPDGKQSLLVRPWVDLTSGDATVGMDATAGRPVAMSPPRGSWMLGTVLYYGGAGFATEGGLVSDGSLDGDLVAGLGPDAPADRFAATVTGHFAEPGRDGDFADSPYRYNAGFTRYGQMWQGFSRRLGASDFVAVTARDRQPGQANRALLGVSSSAGRGAVGPVRWDYPLSVDPARARTEYFTAGDVRWSATYARMRVSGDVVDQLAEESAGVRHVGAGSSLLSWGAAVVAPAFATDGSGPPAARRAGDVLTVALPLFSPSTPGSTGTSPVTRATTTVYRAGTPIGHSDGAGAIRVDVPAAVDTYRLETEATRNVSDLSTSVTAAWTFRSGYTEAGGLDGDPLPLLVVRFGPTPETAAVPCEVPVRVQWQRPGTATLTRLAVEVSDDDGGHWQPAAVADGVVRLPPGGGRYVSLRAHAADSVGNQVDETIVHAFALAER